MTTVKKDNPSGNVMIAVMLVMVVGILVTSLAMGLLVTSTQEANDIFLAERVRVAAESGVENGIMRILRDPQYPGESMTVNTIPVQIMASTPSGTYQLIVAATASAYQHRYQVTLQRVNGILKITSWQETF